MTALDAGGGKAAVDDGDGAAGWAGAINAKVCKVGFQFHSNRGFPDPLGVLPTLTRLGVDELPVLGGRQLPRLLQQLCKYHFIHS